MQGGRGGQGNSGLGGVGGYDGAANPATAGSGDSGGGGGAAGGYAGGAGGNAGSGDRGGDGGRGGVNGTSPPTPGANAAAIFGGAGQGGGAGAAGFGAGGGGGGVGGYGLIVSAAVLDGSGRFSNSGTFRGGHGGTGGAGSSTSVAGRKGGSGGGGGGGSDGVFMADPSAQFENAGAIEGGAGGDGGASGTGGTVGAIAGQGGDGGDGFRASAGVLVNTAAGSIVGGRGGGNGMGGSNVGVGGAGVSIATGTTAAVTNFGRITGGVGGAGYTAGVGGTGVRVTTGIFTNDGNGTVTGGYGGLGTDRSGRGGYGASVNGGTIRNLGNATITGGDGSYSIGRTAGGGRGGILATAGSTIVNTGFIKGGDAGSSDQSSAAGGDGIVATSATITNGGTITGGRRGDGPATASTSRGGYGIDGTGVTLVNTGSIVGAMSTSSVRADAAHFSGASKLALGQSASFTGAIFVFGGSLTFDQSLASGLPLDATISTTIAGGGALYKVGAGKLTLLGQNTFAGSTHVQAGTIEIGASASAGTGRIVFDAASGGSATLALASGAGGTFANTLDSFGDGDAVDLEAFPFDSMSTTLVYDTTAHTLKVTSGGGTSKTFNLTNETPGTDGTFHAHRDADGGTVIDNMVCFVSGTVILTARGEVEMEDLKIGDLAVTASGAPRPIHWIGRRRLDAPGGMLPHDAQPIRVIAGAFGAGLPERDLWLSPGHPVLVGADKDGTGGHLVPIMCLINGTTIERVPVDSVTYWHVELDEHDILLAEGLPAESYLDWGDRAFFTEGSDHALANPDFVVPGLAGRCRPVALEGPIVEAERRRLDAIFAMGLAEACAWPDHEDDALFIDVTIGQAHELGRVWSPIDARAGRT